MYSKEEEEEAKLYSEREKILQSSFKNIVAIKSPSLSSVDDDDKLEQTSEHQNIHAMALAGFSFFLSPF